MQLSDALQWELVYYGRFYNPDLGLILVKRDKTAKRTAKHYLGHARYS